MTRKYAENRIRRFLGPNFQLVIQGGRKMVSIGQLWFRETFLPNIGKERPQLLICDGHASHNNVEFLKLAREQDIIIGELSSHTSHWTQPFDRAVFKLLKSNWNTQVDTFVKETGVPLGHSRFLRVFSRAWKNSMTTANVRSGFKATGIYPFDPSAIPDLAFKPSEITSAVETQSAQEGQSSSSLIVVTSPILPPTD